MINPDALMVSLSSNLDRFLKGIEGNLRVAEKKFLRDAVVGLVRAGHPIVCPMAREIPDQQCKYTTRVKRLDPHLTVETDFDERVMQPLPDIWLLLMTDDTPLIQDLSDLAKPLAEKMDYLATVRGASTGHLSKLCRDLRAYVIFLGLTYSKTVTRTLLSGPLQKTPAPPLTG